ncbi:GntR family transcriptional regulator [Streptomyces sp. WMMB 714]|uniref:GntR family transcriptional regulator n=1 Tax=Streptomyces sp. WMMB 714 TaxID=1286822 RepID=UPI0005F7CA14|nr:GntR family transcriptional regulator [Streptomyces sp. WMMB 714]SCK23746.1 GntR family transcriptional regulator [Streptomyces sp. WMMB 714]
MPETPARQIADDLRARIKSGDLAPGTRLPGEPALVRQYGVAKQTAANALKLLTLEGLAIARPGSGTYVREFKLIRRSGTERLSREGRALGRSVWAADVEDRPLEVDGLDVREAKAPDWVAEALGLSGEDTAVVVRSRRYLVDGEPVQLATSYLPAGLVRGTRVAEPDTGPGGTYARLAELNAEPVDFTEELRARMPDPDEAEALAQPPGSPLIEIVRVARTPENRPVEVNRMLLDAGSYVLDYRFSG